MMSMRKFVSSAVVVVLGVVALSGRIAEAHGHLKNSINQEVDIRFTDPTVDACGVLKAQTQTALETGSKKPFMFFRGQSNELTYRMTNSDGAGPLTLTIDSKCEGTTFDKTLTIPDNVPGVNGILNDNTLPKDFKFNVTVPNDLKCSCSNQNVCLLRITTPQSFTSCIFVAPVDKSRGFNNLASFQGGAMGFGGMQQPFGPSGAFGQYPQQAFGGSQVAFGSSYGSSGFGSAGYSGFSRMPQYSQYPQSMGFRSGAVGSGQFGMSYGGYGYNSPSQDFYGRF